MTMSRSISVVLPCYNEEQNIPATVEDVASWIDRMKLEGEIVCVNDGSKDGTEQVLASLSEREPRVKIVTHATNQGYGAAVRSGCDAATKDVIAFMDSDGQFHAEDLGKLLEKISDATPYVTGLRVHRADKFYRKINAFLYRLLVRVRLGVKIEDLNCGMKMFTKAIWPTIRPVVATGALINAEMFYRMRMNGIRWGTVPVGHYPRRAGQPTGANVWVILKMFRDLGRLRSSADHSDVGK